MMLSGPLMFPAQGGSTVPQKDALFSAPAEVSPGVFLPHSRYEATVKIEGYDVRFVVNITSGSAECESFTIAKTHGSKSRPITGEVLRSLPIAAWLHRSMEMTGAPFTIVEGERTPMPTQTMIERQHRQPKSVLLPTVVEAYRRAVADPKTAHSPTQAVADQLGYARGHISRLLSQARQTDPPMLGPAVAGRSGELRNGKSKS